MDRFEAAEARGECECGQPLATHPDLPRPRPLRSWHAVHADSEDTARRREAALLRAESRVEPVVIRTEKGLGLHRWR